MKEKKKKTEKNKIIRKNGKHFLIKNSDYNAYPELITHIRYI